MNFRILYFASLRDAAGRDVEQVVSDAKDTRALYTERQQAHAFAWSAEKLRVAVNGEFADWNRALSNGDEVAFLPPVSGG